ncbi:MAG: MobA/MobL family protein, partial [Eubacteriaceae bacterium]|nr:MobA/MobL family protein [Eubacteriaceae bacterium]
QAAERIYDERAGAVRDYTRKMDVIHTQIFLPEGAPEAWLDRRALWNAAEKAERARNARVGVALVIALPVEMGKGEWVRLVELHCKVYTSMGRCADIAIHDDGRGNPHAHVLLTSRSVEGGLLAGPKPRDWGDNSELVAWRQAWERDCNAILDGRAHVDHRSLKAQGLDREPTIHLGPAAAEKERRGERTGRGDRNREIAQENARRSAARMAGAVRSYASEKINHRAVLPTFAGR